MSKVTDALAKAQRQRKSNSGNGFQASSNGNTAISSGKAPHAGNGVDISFAFPAMETLDETMRKIQMQLLACWKEVYEHKLGQTAIESRLTAHEELLRQAELKLASLRAKEKTAAYITEPIGKAQEKYTMRLAALRELRAISHSGRMAKQELEVSAQVVERMACTHSRISGELKTCRERHEGLCNTARELHERLMRAQEQMGATGGWQ